MWAHVRVKPVAIHAQIGGCIPVANDAGLELKSHLYPRYWPGCLFGVSYSGRLQVFICESVSAQRVSAQERFFYRDCASVKACTNLACVTTTVACPSFPGLVRVLIW